MDQLLGLGGGLGRGGMYRPSSYRSSYPSSYPSGYGLGHGDRHSPSRVGHYYHPQQQQLEEEDDYYGNAFPRSQRWSSDPWGRKAGQGRHFYQHDPYEEDPYYYDLVDRRQPQARGGRRSAAAPASRGASEGSRTTSGRPRRPEEGEFRYYDPKPSGYEEMEDFGTRRRPAAPPQASGQKQQRTPQAKRGLPQQQPPPQKASSRSQSSSGTFASPASSPTGSGAGPASERPRRHFGGVKLPAQPKAGSPGAEKTPLQRKLEERKWSRFLPKRKEYRTDEGIEVLDLGLSDDKEPVKAPDASEGWEDNRGEFHHY